MLQLNKVAKITLIFWLMKIVATTLGETLGDFISMTLNLGYVAGIAITLFFSCSTWYTAIRKKLHPCYLLAGNCWNYNTGY
jgi:uncharacterized membrane-anchored protein